jgi:hypothetical protein
MAIDSIRPWAAGVFTLLLGVAGILSSREGKIPEAELHRPTAMPDRIILNWSGDPATTQSVTWRTDTATERGIAQIAESEDGPGFAAKAVVVNGTSELLTTDLGEARYHSAAFANLKPATQYVYRVGDGFNWSEWNQFRTAAAGPAPLTFLYVGDAQNDLYSMWSRLIRQGYMDAFGARFIIHAGDLINRAVRDAEWGEWHRAAGWINHSLVSFPVPGNHEYGGEERTLAKNWQPQFTLPRNGVPGLEETNYWLDVQGTRVIALNSNRMIQEQAAWLDKLLAGNPQTWTVVAFHHPVYSTAKGRDNKLLRETWQPIFDKHAVDLVLTGHDHSYGRTNLVTGAAARSGKSGTVYVVSVSGPKMYSLDDGSAGMQRRAEDTQLFQIIRIAGNRLSFEARTAKGTLYDAFDLEKRRGKQSKLVNRTPRTPERRKPAVQVTAGD